MTTPAHYAGCHRVHLACARERVRRLRLDLAESEEALSRLERREAALDAAMEELGLTREPRHRESDMVEAIARQHLQMRLKLGHTDHRTPGAAVFREAMSLLGYVPTDRYNARALGRALADTYNALADSRETVAALEYELAACRDELARLRLTLPPAGDEPTEEMPMPANAPIFDVPPGLRVEPLHPATPAARAGHRWWNISLGATLGVMLRATSPEAVRAALDVLRCADWLDLDADCRDALTEAATLPGVSRGVPTQAAA